MNNYEEINNIENENNAIYNNNFTDIEENENEDESISQKEAKKEDINNTNENQNTNNYESTNCPRKFENNILNIQETCNVNIIEKSNKEKEKEIKMSIKQNLENKINDNEKLFEENSELKNQELLNSSNKKISSGNKSKRSSNKITMEIKTKIPQSNELLFNPRNSKKKQIEPLFSKYEQLEGQERHTYTKSNEPLYKKAVEIFPSKFGTEMYYKSQFRQSDYSNNNINSSNKKSEKNNNSNNIGKKRTEKIKKENNNVKKELFKVKNYSNKTYKTYKSNIKSDNPFVGLSHYEKNTKERKNQIIQTIQKEGDEYSDILIFEDNVLNKRILSREELNQFINILIKFLFEKNERNLDSYEHKIGKVINIIKNMKKEEQNIVLTNLKATAKDEYACKIYEKIQNKIDDFKEKITKVYKNEQNLEEDEDIIFKLKPTTSNKKKSKK